MSHNPTYDPEPGYSPYSGGDRSGHSTPPQYYSSGGASLPASDAGPYTNMASYRQATTGPPGGGFAEPPAGNGKSYRFATAEPIPEDDGDVSPVGDSRQVQFSDLGSEKNNMNKGYGSKSGGMASGAASDRKFMILAVVAAIFALLFIIFLGLFIWKASTTSGGSGGETTPSVASPGGVIGSDTTTVAVTNTEKASTTTVAPVEIPRESLGMYNSKEEFKYTLSNKNNVAVEVLTLGARLNRLTRGNVPYIMGLNASDLTGVASDKEGAWHGPVCEDNPDLHQQHFEGSTTADGSLQLTATMSGINVVFLYTLDDSDKLTVKVTGTTSGGTSAKMDICSSSLFNLNADGTGVITNTHSLQVNSIKYYNAIATAWLSMDGGYSDFTSRKSVSVPITDTKTKIAPSQEVLTYVYSLAGPTGWKYAATIDGTSNRQVKVQTNQPIMQVSFDLVTVDSIRLLAKSQPLVSDEPVDKKITLSSDSVYEFVLTYEV